MIVHKGFVKESWGWRALHRGGYRRCISAWAFNRQIVFAVHCNSM